MKSATKSKEKISVGLDIGTQNVKIVKLKFVQDAVEVISVALEPMQEDPAEALKKIKLSLLIDSVNIALSGPATVIRNINFPKMNDDELKQALKFEAQKHIPFPLAEVSMDGCILKDDLPDNKMLVLLAAVKKESLSQRLRTIERAGLKTNIIEIDSLALINAFNFNYGQEESLKPKVIALMNIGAAITNVNIIEGGIPRLSRDIQIAGNNFTQKIADTLGLDFKSAEGAKVNPDADQSGKILLALETVFTALATEIRTSFDYYESQSASSVGKIFLSGGGSLFPGLKDKLKSLLNIEVDHWDPLKNIKMSPGMDAEKLKPLCAQLAVAVGLALRQ